MLKGVYAILQKLDKIILNSRNTFFGERVNIITHAWRSDITLFTEKAFSTCISYIGSINSLWKYDKFSIPIKSRFSPLWQQVPLRYLLSHRYTASQPRRTGLESSLQWIPLKSRNTNPLSISRHSFLQPDSFFLNLTSRHVCVYKFSDYLRHVQIIHNLRRGIPATKIPFSDGLFFLLTEILLLKSP